MTEENKKKDKEKTKKTSKTDTGHKPGEIDLEPELDNRVHEEDLSEVSIQQRIKRRVQMKRHQPRLRVGRRRAERRGATQDVVKRRAQRRARSAVKKRLSGGRAITGASDRKRIERMADKRKNLITRLAKRKRVDVRRDASKRRSTRREDLDILFTNFLLSEEVNIHDDQELLESIAYVYDLIHEDEIGEYIEEMSLEEAEGKKLNKVMSSDRDDKKYMVHVKNEKGNVITVHFGDPNMRIKTSDPDARKSFRARHNCDNPGPKTKARYWSCKMWSTDSVKDHL